MHQDYWMQKRYAKGLIGELYGAEDRPHPAESELAGASFRAVRSRTCLPWPLDQAHEQLSGTFMKREFAVYGNAEFERLAEISNGHLYNRRRSPARRFNLFDETSGARS